MIISPSGKKAQMVTQMFKQSQTVDLPVDRNDVERVPIINNNSQQETQPAQQTQNELDISDIVIKFLVKLGWPERKLYPVKKEIVKEKISPDGKNGFKKEVTVTVLGSYYKSNKPISDKELQGLIQSINQKTKLQWTGGSRDGDKITITFNSDSQPVNPTADPDEEKIKGVYGKGAKSASTLSEMINERKAELHNILMKIAQNKDK